MGLGLRGYQKVTQLSGFVLERKKETDDMKLSDRNVRKRNESGFF